MATVTREAPAATTSIVEPEGLYEVIGSTVVEKPPMGSYEADVAAFLHELLAPFVRERRLGRAIPETLFDLRPAVDRSRRPDVAFVSAARWPVGRRAPKSPAWAIVPDLAIEIVSPTNSATEVMEKLEDYFRAGVRLVWVVYPDQRKVYVYESTTQVRVLGGGDTIDGGAVVPGFRMALPALFDDEPEPA